MRTTLDIDDDVLHAVKDRARDERRSAGAVLSELARRALTEPAPIGAESFLGFRPLPKRGGVVTNELIDRLRGRRHLLMRALLDVNVLLALLDQDHMHHPRARQWLEEHQDAGWASCAITQNGFVRIISRVHLLALAVQAGGRLVTFDRSTRTDPVRTATAEHLIVL